VEKSNAAVAASPTIRKLARDLGIDLAKVRGSARGGRVTMEDVRGSSPRTSPPHYCGRGFGVCRMISSVSSVRPLASVRE
jgi:hypothetical protein